MNYIKQYGIQRSGTNYMRALLELNLNVRVLSNIGGFKHGDLLTIKGISDKKPNHAKN